MSSTVNKALRVLELLGEGEMRLVDLSGRMGEHKSAVQRLLVTLESRGFVRQDEATRRYSLGLTLLRLASSSLADMDLRDAARDLMRRLGESSGETVHLGVYDEPHVVYIDKIESVHPVRMYSRIGARAGSHCTGVGKALVSFLDKAGFEAYLARASFEGFTPRTITTAAGCARRRPSTPSVTPSPPSGSSPESRSRSYKRSSATPAVTMNVYAHVLPHIQEDSMGRFERLFSDPAHEHRPTRS